MRGPERHFARVSQNGLAHRGALLGPRNVTEFNYRYGDPHAAHVFVGVQVGDARVVVHHEGRAALLPGDRVEFGVLPGALRFFDAETGTAIRTP